MADAAIYMQTERDSSATTVAKTRYSAWAKAGLVLGTTTGAFLLAKATGAWSWASSLLSSSGDVTTTAPDLREVQAYTPAGSNIATFGSIASNDALINTASVVANADTGFYQQNTVKFDELQLPAKPTPMQQSQITEKKSQKSPIALQSVPTNGLVAYYPFNGNANDESGNGNNGTVHNATLTTDRFGNPNSAYSFDGAFSTYMNAPSAQFPQTSRTISIWFYANNLDRSAIFGYGAYGGTNSIWYQGINTAPWPGAFVVVSEMNHLPYNYTVAPIKSWHHWITTVNVSNIKIYIDGVFVAQDSFAVTTRFSNDVAFGTLTNGNAPYPDPAGNSDWRNFNGTLDDIRVYNRALSDSEITALYQEGTSGSISPTGAPTSATPSVSPTDLPSPTSTGNVVMPTEGLIAYYPFNGNANDASGNGINGVVYSATLTTDRFGNANSAYSFDATSSYIQTATNSLLFSINFSLSAWLYPLSVNGARTILGRCYDVLKIWDETNVCGYQTSTAPLLLGNKSFVTQQWQHVLVTYDSTILNLYFNGSLDSSLSRSITHTELGAALTIGAGNCQPFGQVFNGTLDDIRIYNRALSAVEINSLYQEGTSTSSGSISPTGAPTSAKPSGSPTLTPSGSPTYLPSPASSRAPSYVPTIAQSASPTVSQTGSPTFVPSTEYSPTTSTTVPTVAVNHLPILSTIDKIGEVDVGITFSVNDFTAHFKDIDGDSLTKIKILSLPLYGILKLHGVAVTIQQEVSVENLVGLSFEPNPNWNGHSSFLWNGFDGQTYSVNPASVNLQVNMPETSASTDLKTVVGIGAGVGGGVVTCFGAAYSLYRKRKNAADRAHNYPFEETLRALLKFEAAKGFDMSTNSSGIGGKYLEIVSSFKNTLVEQGFDIAQIRFTKGATGYVFLQAIAAEIIRILKADGIIIQNLETLFKKPSFITFSMDKYNEIIKPYLVVDGVELATATSKDRLAHI